MTNNKPLATGITTAPADELSLRPDTNGINVGLGLGVTREGEPVALVKLVFNDPNAGNVCIELDTRTGHPEHIHAQLDRLLKAIHYPAEHPEDAAEVEAMLGDMYKRITGKEKDK